MVVELIHRPNHIANNCPDQLILPNLPLAAAFGVPAAWCLLDPVDPPAVTPAPAAPPANAN